MSRDSFERFYLERVALSEACGCAEAVIRVRDIDASATAGSRRRRAPVRGKRKPGRLLFRRLLFR